MFSWVTASEASIPWWFPYTESLKIMFLPELLLFFSGEDQGWEKRKMDEGRLIFPKVRTSSLLFLVDCSGAWLLGQNMVFVHQVLSHRWLITSDGTSSLACFLFVCLFDQRTGDSGGVWLGGLSVGIKSGWRKLSIGWMPSAHVLMSV